MYESLRRFPDQFLEEFDRIQSELQQMLLGSVGLPASIRAVERGAFPAINIGTTAKSVEVYAFVPGIDPAKIDLTLDRGLLTVAGERAADLPQQDDRANVYARERYAGPFKRVVSLPDDADPSRVDARYRDGVLRVSIQRRESAQPKRIEVG